MRCEEFCSLFGVQVKVQRVGNDCFLADERFTPFMAHRPYSAGVFLGTEGKQYLASLALLDLIAARGTTRKLTINEKAEWLFLCGRDLMRGSIMRCSVDTGFVLVVNARNEALGLGDINVDLKTAKDDRIVVKNILNKGWYLGK